MHIYRVGVLKANRQFIQKNLIRLTKGRNKIKILEVGIGPGRIANEILKYPVEYYGLDISNKMIEVFKKRFTGNGKVKKLIVADIALSEPYKNITFDCIVAMRIIYYSKNWKQVISKLTNKLQKGGTIIFCMLNRNSTALLGKLMGDGEIKGYYSTKNELTTILAENNLTCIRISGYARIPDLIYDLAKTKSSAKVVSVIEDFLRGLLGDTLGARMFYVVAKKN